MNKYRAFTIIPSSEDIENGMTSKKKRRLNKTVRTKIYSPLSKEN